jgi:hypothetical protein
MHHLEEAIRAGRVSRTKGVHCVNGRDVGHDAQLVDLRVRHVIRADQLRHVEMLFGKV